MSAPRDGRGLSYRNIVYGTILVLLGLGGLLVGVSIPLIVVGVIGFLVMLGGVILAVAPGKGAPRATAADAPRAAKPANRSTFMDRMNDRWDRRQEDR